MTVTMSPEVEDDECPHMPFGGPKAACAICVHGVRKARLLVAETAAALGDLKVVGSFKAIYSSFCTECGTNIRVGQFIYRIGTSKEESSIVCGDCVKQYRAT